MIDPTSRGDQLTAELRDLLVAVPELQAAAVVSFDGLPMASVLPADMNEDRVAAMSAALLSLGEKASQGLGRGDLSQVFVEGDNGTVFLVACEAEAVLVAVAVVGAKKGLVLYEVRRTAGSLAEILRDPAPADSSEVWVDHVMPESDIFTQALADAEAAYQAHRAESVGLVEQPDINVVYTPSPPEFPAANFSTAIPPATDPEDPVHESPASWFSDSARRWDVR
jgi:predicted regulator of Ras-like GTPase activity (Roadblock/LC7/MglB family)